MQISDDDRSVDIPPPLQVISDFLAFPNILAYQRISQPLSDSSVVSVHCAELNKAPRQVIDLQSGEDSEDDHDQLQHESVAHISQATDTATSPRVLRARSSVKTTSKLNISHIKAKIGSGYESADSRKKHAGESSSSGAVTTDQESLLSGESQTVARHNRTPDVTSSNTALPPTTEADVKSANKLMRQMGNSNRSPSAAEIDSLCTYLNNGAITAECMLKQATGTFCNVVNLLTFAFAVGQTQERNSLISAVLKILETIVEERSDTLSTGAAVSIVCLLCDHVMTVSRFEAGGHTNVQR